MFLNFWFCVYVIYDLLGEKLKIQEYIIYKFESSGTYLT